MDFSHIRRNDPCPCGSGKKFKSCHMGREQEIMNDRIQVDSGEMALRIQALPESSHERAKELAAGLEFTSAAGKKIKVKFKDLAAYQALGYMGQQTEPGAIAGVMINPFKTRVLDPEHIYVAISPRADDSSILHELAHVADYVEGSALIPGRGGALSRETGVPVELLEHPQEYGERLMELAGRFEVELDAEDEIVAILARRKMLLSGKEIAKGQKEPLVAAAQKAMTYMKESQDEIDARIKGRKGYVGKK